MVAEATQPTTKPQTLREQFGMPKRRRILSLDVLQMAQLMSETPLTEREACLQLNLHPDQWKVFKWRHKETFETLLARIKGADLRNIIERIRLAGTSGPKPDWRALAYVGEKVHPDRLGPHIGQQAQSSPSVTINILMESLAKMLPKPMVKQVENKPEVKAIEGQKLLANNDVSSNIEGKSQ